ncbi:MAG: hypothetical protein KGN79_02210 [Acidobacteriota bacterium]|nr:hypothetical protein [Acidobacteriota bacterium]
MSLPPVLKKAKTAAQANNHSMKPNYEESNERRRIGVELTCNWNESTLLELQVKATNGVFAGLARPLIAQLDLQAAARCLEGYPRNFQDCREVTFGDSRERFAGGFISLRFSCRDAAGHCAVEVQIVSKNETVAEPRWNRLPQSVIFVSAVDASAIADFAGQLRAMGETHSGSAWLQFGRA